MASWFGSARSNHFSVRDAETFRRWVDDSGLWTLEHMAGRKRRFAIFGDEWHGGWPAGDLAKPFDIAAELGRHVMPGRLSC